MKPQIFIYLFLKYIIIEIISNYNHIWHTEFYLTDVNNFWTNNVQSQANPAHCVTKITCFNVLRDPHFAPSSLWHCCYLDFAYD